MTQDDPVAARATAASMYRNLLSGAQAPDRLSDISVNDRSGTAESPVRPGDVVAIAGRRYRVVPRIDGGILGALMPDSRVTAPVRLHAGMHKCMTQFTRAVYRDVARFQRPLRRLQFRSVGFRHFYHDIVDFHARGPRYSLTSLSGQRIDIDSFDDLRIVRFIRDPRDLLVSGYYYHLRGKEPWSAQPAPSEGGFRVVNGGVPEALGPGQSLQHHLETASIEDGMAAEIAFRRPHFHAWASWPIDDPRILVLRYEDILGNEPAAFDRIGHHMGWSAPERWRARRAAWAFSSGGREAHRGHVRNKSPAQWRDHLGAAQNRAFVAEFGAILAAHGYPEN